MHKKIYILNKELWFPHPRQARYDGLLAIGGDLSPERLILAYSNGIFPWYSKDEPIMWWCTHPRFILFTKKLHISSSLRKLLKKNPFTISFDRAFDRVIENCAYVRLERGEDTWINNDMMDAYKTLHRYGFCHSVEAWLESELVGGVYGVCIGRVFFGESMFYRVSNASKIAFVFLVKFLEKCDIKVIDCQMKTQNLQRFGAEYINLEDFLSILRRLTRENSKAPFPFWHLDDGEMGDILKSF